MNYPALDGSSCQRTSHILLLPYPPMFSGSYPSEDVTFLLKPVRLESTALAEKERLIQSGQRHYSEMITREQLPSERYLQTFYQALAAEKTRFARHLWQLAAGIVRFRSPPITLVSLARAGTPIGVLLKRLLTRRFPHRVEHYSISIIRDRGIDEAALKFILSRHADETLVFVDGWTGKGVIAQELNRAIARFNERQGVQVNPGLFVVADLCGYAEFTATAEDYLIPSSVLGATISGLVSRSILNRDVIGPGEFHGCLYYEDFQPHDLSNWFVAQLLAEIDRLPLAAIGAEKTLAAQNFALRQMSRAFLTNMQERFGVRNPNLVKPGIGEATRVLLRRVPHLLLLRAADLPEVAHLRLLAEEKQVPLVIDPGLPYLAAALIQEMDY